MLKILSTNQIRHADQYTIKKEPISSVDLMERASAAFTDWFTERYYHGVEVHVFCGIGNNGGDGLAIARLLTQKRYQVTVYILGDVERSSKEFKVNLKRLRDKAEIHPIRHTDRLPPFSPGDVIIDALFGSGLNRPAEGLFAEVINFINYQPSEVIAVDISSGLLADKHTTGQAIVKANHTVTFQVPKLAFMMPQNALYTGEWHLVNIGLNEQYIRGLDSVYHLLEEKDITRVFKPMNKFAHKGDAGKVLLVAGSTGKAGAAILSARAVMRAGAGLLTVHTPQECMLPLQIAVPEAMVDPDTQNDFFSFPPPIRGYDSIGIGPGLGNNIVTAKALEELLDQKPDRIVLDADALNIIASHPALLKKLPEGAILTPHPGEFRRMVGEWQDDFARLKKQIDFSVKNKVNVVVKGAHSCITNTEGQVFFNNTGNPGMATAGSGDVLTGIISGIVGQGVTPENALMAGVYLHGLAGDLAREEVGPTGMIASDIVANIPRAFRVLQSQI